jgi:steroid 5-alpha reductase family enzyme
MTWTVFWQNGVAVLALLAVLWIASVIKKDVSIVDPWWSMAFLLITTRTMLATGVSSGQVLVLVLVAAWALRLWLHLLIRSRGKPEDPRYTAFRKHYGSERYWWISFFQVFVLQGVLATMISLPLQVVEASPHAIGVTEVLGGALFLVGFIFEWIADRQLQAFRDDPSRRGQVMDSGLWRYSRHPNYFGEALLWWGFWLCSLAVPSGWLTFPAPALMTFLLLRVSGVKLLDKHLSRTKPAYAEYIRRTPAFVPGRPR